MGQGPFQHGPASPGLHELEPINISLNGTPGGSNPQISTLSAQKRAYRQRRKDPSCDACRERKVKCDATETTSCSECSSRNVKCQFTKETNRRMSSIKQVQDLERQIAQVKRENSHLRSLLNMRDGQAVLEPEGQTRAALLLPEVGSHPERKQQPEITHDLSRVRANLRNFGRGIFKPPAPYRQTESQGQYSAHKPELPPKHIADQLLYSYYASVHTTVPILHWPTFEQEYEDVYKAGSLENVPSVWSSLLFAVLGLGLLYNSDPKLRRPEIGKDLLETSLACVSLWNDDFVIDHARSALLTSMFLMEMNNKSAAWTWLASSVRISQDIGLYSENGPWPTIEGEMRRRVWWAIYVWDRLMSLELGRPMLIEDSDCDIALPAAVDEHYICDGGVLMPSDRHSPANLLLSSIHVVRSLSPLIKALKSPIISPGTLGTFDAHFRTCMAVFPPMFQLDSRELLDSRSLAPLIYLMNARIILHRHNLSIFCPPEVRAAAVEQCLHVALDTSRVFSRVSLTTPSYSGPKQIPSLGLTASTLMVTHLWRCTLFLLFTAQYEAALICIRASAAIGSYRDVNIACGRNTAFFLSTLIDKHRGGLSGAADADEELIAYVSGDLQASTDNSWVWQGSELGMGWNPASGASGHDGSSTSVLSYAGGMKDHNNALSEEDARDWGGWERVEYLVQVLIRETPISAQPGPRQPSPGYAAPEASINPSMASPSQLTQPTQPPGPNRPDVKGRATDRISIANII